MERKSRDDYQSLRARAKISLPFAFLPKIKVYANAGAGENCRPKESDDEKDDDAFRVKEKRANGLYARENERRNDERNEKSYLKRLSTSLFSPSCFDASDKSYII